MQRMNAAAESIANAETPSIESVMNLKMAEHAIKTNAAAAAVVYETTDYLLDIMV